jgi:hypothetical protein
MGFVVRGGQMSSNSVHSAVAAASVIGLDGESVATVLGLAQV